MSHIVRSHEKLEVEATVHPFDQRTVSRLTVEPHSKERSNEHVRIIEIQAGKTCIVLTYKQSGQLIKAIQACRDDRRKHTK